MPATIFLMRVNSALVFYVIGARWQGVDLIVHVTDTVSWVGMVAQELSIRPRRILP